MHWVSAPGPSGAAPSWLRLEMAPRSTCGFSENTEQLRETRLDGRGREAQCMGRMPVPGPRTHGSRPDMRGRRTCLSLSPKRLDFQTAVW